MTSWSESTESATAADTHFFEPQGDDKYDNDYVVAFHNGSGYTTFEGVEAEYDDEGNPFVTLEGGYTIPLNEVMRARWPS